MSIVINAKIDGFEAGIAQAEKGLGRLAAGAKEAGRELTTYVTAPLALLGVAAIKTAADMQALEQGFKAVYKGAGDVGVELKKTLEIAKLPGLGLKEALQGSTNLQAAGFSAEQARKTLLAFGGALATVGKGKAELDRVTLALTQINNTSNVMGQDLNQLRQTLPQIGTILQKAFGTTSAEGLRSLGVTSKQFIEVVTTEFGKLPQVTGGLKNALENMSDAGVLSLAKLGEAANKALDLEGVAVRVSEALTGLANAFSELSPEAQKTVLALAGVAAGAGPVLFTIGALGKAFPVAVEGFKLMRGAGVALATSLGPVGLAIAAISAALVYFIATNKSAQEEFNESSQRATQLSNDLNPLLAKYEELSAKAKLTVEEQIILKETIQKIGEVAPATITAIDQYGKTLSISAAAARDLIKANKELASIDAAKALPATQAQLKDLDTRLAQARKTLADFNKGIVATVPVFNSQGMQTGVKKAIEGPEDIVALKKKTAQLVKAQIDQLTEVNKLRTAIGLVPLAYKSDNEAALLEEKRKQEARLKAAREADQKLFDSKKELEAKIKKLEEENDVNDKSETEIAANNVLIKGYRDRIKELDNIGLASKQSIKDATALQKAQEEFRVGLVKANNEFKLQGDMFDVAGEKAKVYKKYMDDLITLDKTGGKVVDTKQFQAAAVEFKRLTALSQEFLRNADFREIFLDAQVAINSDAEAIQTLGRNTDETVERVKVLEAQLATSLRAVEAMKKAGAEDNNAYLAAEIEQAKDLTAQLEKAREAKRQASIASTTDTLLDSLNAPRKTGLDDLLSGDAVEDLMTRIREARKAIDELVENNASEAIIKQARDGLDSLKADLDLTNVYSSAAAQAADSLAEIGLVITEGLGSIITGQMSLTDGLQSIFLRTLGIVGNFMKDFGKQLLLLGAGHVAMGLATYNPVLVAQGKLELLAGGALALGGGIVGSVASAGGGRAATPTSSAASSPTVSSGSRAGEKQNVNLTVKFEPVELRADGPALRSVMQVDEYRLSTGR